MKELREVTRDEMQSVNGGDLPPWIIEIGVIINGTVDAVYGLGCRVGCWLSQL